MYRSDKPVFVLEKDVFEKYQRLFMFINIKMFCRTARRNVDPQESVQYNNKTISIMCNWFLLFNLRVYFK